MRGVIWLPLEPEAEVLTPAPTPQSMTEASSPMPPETLPPSAVLLRLRVSVDWTSTSPEVVVTVAWSITAEVLFWMLPISTLPARAPTPPITSAPSVLVSFTLLAAVTLMPLAAVSVPEPMLASVLEASSSTETPPETPRKSLAEPAATRGDMVSEEFACTLVEPAE